MQKSINEYKCEVTNCIHSATIYDLTRQTEKIDKFISDAEPLMDYVKAEIDRNNRRAEMYMKITENVLGASVLFALAAIGSWVWKRIIEGNIIK